MSKLVEKVVVKQLHEHLLKNDLYAINQSAYRKYHSTETALIKICNDFLCEMDNNKCVLLVMLDQSAAFDTVHQDLLLYRLQSTFGVQGQALTWFTSYFKHRYQCVSVNGQASDPKQLATGFP